MAFLRRPGPPPGSRRHQEKEEDRRRRHYSTNPRAPPAYNLPDGIRSGAAADARSPRPYNPYAAAHSAAAASPYGGGHRQGSDPPPLSDPHGWFTYFDRDGSGALDQEEVIAGLVRTHPSLDASSVREQVYAVWPAFDSDGSGRVERHEFCSPGGMGEALRAATEPARRAQAQAQAPSQSYTPQSHAAPAAYVPTSVGGGEGGGEQLWTCDRCTFVNGGGDSRCKACNGPPPAGGIGGGGGEAAYIPGAAAAAAAPVAVAVAAQPYVPGLAANVTPAATPYVPGQAAVAQPYVSSTGATPAATAASATSPFVPAAQPYVPSSAATPPAPSPSAPPTQNPNYQAVQAAAPYVPGATAPAAQSQPARAQVQQQQQQQFQTVRVNVPPGMRPGQKLGVKTGQDSDTTVVTIPPRDQWKYPGSYFDVRIPKTSRAHPPAPTVVQGKYAGGAGAAARPHPQSYQSQAMNHHQDTVQQVQLLPWQTWDSFAGHSYQPIPLGMQHAPPDQVAPPHSVSGVMPTGRKRALLVGINYRGTRAELRGCVNDARNMKEVLSSQGFRDDPSHMVMLVDEGTSSSYKPTHRNIMKGMQWLVHNAVPGDVLFFHFSGHGAQMPDKTGHEADGFNETILPVDYKSGGQISDDVIWGNLVWPLRSGVRLTALMDCCHSGTGLDLPFEYDLKRRRWVEDINPAHSKGDVVQFSGCEDAQTSADAGGDPFSKYQAGGAMTQSFIRAFKENPYASYPSFMDAIHRHLKRRGFPQRPALTSSQAFDVSARVFSFAEGIEPNRNAQIGRIKRKHIKPGRGNGSNRFFDGLGGAATAAGAMAGAAALANLFLGD